MFSVVYFLFSLGIFLILTFLLILFGYFLQYFLLAGFKQKPISLSIVLESFGVGIVLFIFYSYFIIDFLRLFNFITIYLPLIIFDSISIIYIFYRYNLFKKEFLKKLPIVVKNKISTDKVKKNLTILIPIFVLFIIVQSVIETHLNYPSKDPYTWFEISMYLRKYGDLNYKNYTVHGVGFAIFIAGALLITDSFYIQYFFVKYVSSFFFSIIILTVYNISSKIFKKDIEISLILIVLLSFNSLLIRFSLSVPSIIATTLGVIFFNTMLQEEENRILIIRGLLLGGMFLTHPLYFLLLFLYLVLYELIIISFYFKKYLKNRSIRIKPKILSFILKTGVLLLISLIMTIPYFLNLFFSGKNLYKNFTRYLFRGYEADLHNLIINYNFSTNILLLLNVSPSRTDILYNLFFLGLDIPINKTLNWGVIFLIIGLLSNINFDNNQKQKLVGFIKFSFIFTFLIFILSSFMFIIDNNIILSLASFINQYGKRCFELFAPIWAILFILGVISIFEFIKKSRKNFSTYKKNQTSIEELEQKFDKTYKLFLIILGISLYSSHLYLQYNVLYTSHYEDDHLTDALLYIGDYFNSKDIEDKTILLPENVDPEVIFRLIYHRDIEREYFEFDNSNYTSLMNEVDKESADFVLVYKLEAKDSCLEEIDDEHKILYENPNYLFFKVK